MSEEPRAHGDLRRVAEDLLHQKHSNFYQRYFGPELFERFQKLAAQADDQRPFDQVKRRGWWDSKGRAFILPGIMGSELGYSRNLLPDDVIWASALAILRGRLPELSLDDPRPEISALGVLPYYYLNVWLNLYRDGYDVDYWAYDWRQPIRQTGREFAKRLVAEDAAEINVVAHSMGGLICRAALGNPGANKLRRVVMLGTPNHGSFSPPMVFAGQSQTVGWLTALSDAPEREALIRDVLGSFDGLYDMFPSPEKYSDDDLFDPDFWTSNGRTVSVARLRRARHVIPELPKPDSRFYMIAGVGHETADRIASADGEIEFGYGDGDDTVPLELAQISGVRKTYFYHATHTGLPLSIEVMEGVEDLLEDKQPSHVFTTAEAARQHRSARRAEPIIHMPQTREQARLRLHEVISVLGRRADEVTPVPSSGDFGPSHRAPPKLNRVSIGRQHKHRLDLALYQGSLTNIKTRAVLAGIFEDLRPDSGAIGALNQALGGALVEAYDRRVFRAGTGQMFILPAGRHSLPADFVILLGLGPYSRFTHTTQQTITQSLVNTLTDAGVEEFATVLLGSNSGESLSRTLTAMVNGFLTGLQEHDRDHFFRQVILCEFDPARYAEMREVVVNMSLSPALESVDLILHELPPEPVDPSSRNMVAAVPSCPGTNFLDCRVERSSEASISLMQTLLPVNPSQAGLRRVPVDIDLRSLRDLADELETGRNVSFASLPRRAEEFTQSVLWAGFHAPVAEHPLVVIQDPLATKVPWELMRVDGEFLATSCGIARLFTIQKAQTARWLKRRRQEATLHILLIVNPTEDLPGADAEAAAIEHTTASMMNISLEKLVHGEATRDEVVKRFGLGKYDVIHYAGHAQFEAGSPARSGLYCSDGLLTASHLQGLESLPTMLFLNACESARVRGRQEATMTRAQTLANVSEAFLSAGIGCLIGTYWPVSDSGAAIFAEHFYQEVLAGRSIGQSVLRGRQQLEANRSIDAYNYILYGDPQFQVKLGSTGPTR